MRRSLKGLASRFVVEIGYGAKLDVSEAYPVYLAGRPNPAQYPNADLPGVYVFCNEHEVLYVGKCSRKLGKRIWEHLGKPNASDTGDTFPYADDWVKATGENLLLYTVPVPDNHWWLAPALEGFMAEELTPTAGSPGRRS